jgi:hypothetical protein
VSLVLAIASNVQLTSSLKGRPIVTEIAPIGKWHAGEDYHQEYRMSPLTSSRSRLTLQSTTIPVDTSALLTDSTGRLRYLDLNVLHA